MFDSEIRKKINYYERDASIEEIDGGFFVKFPYSITQQRLDFLKKTLKLEWKRIGLVSVVVAKNK